jgi:hypothetical protein
MSDASPRQAVTSSRRGKIKMRVQEAPSPLNRVIEKLATSDKPTLTIERLPDGKMRVTSASWDGEKVFLRDQVLEARWVDGTIHVARKERHPDEWDRPVEPYDPYGPGVDEEDLSEFVADNSEGV